MIACDCREPHEQRRIVLTGGPGAGKTAVLELVRQYLCKHVEVLPEAAGILFSGGFRRGTTTAGREGAQRAIFHVQREQESVAKAEGNSAVLLCDRGTVDGFAYWPGRTDFWEATGTTRTDELARYDAVIHLRTPGLAHGYNHSNPVRIESAAEAGVIDERIAAAWAGHPRLFVVESTPAFLVKAQRAIAILSDQMPDCCKHHQVPLNETIRV
jgi:predicted ATPase